MKQNSLFRTRHFTYPLATPLHLADKIMNIVFLTCGIITIACVGIITIYLIISGLPAIKEIGIIKFLFGTKWASTAQEPTYGILPFILTSFYGTFGAILLGVPVGFFCAVNLSYGATLFAAIIVLAIMILPSIISVSMTALFSISLVLFVFIMGINAVLSKLSKGDE